MQPRGTEAAIAGGWLGLGIALLLLALMGLPTAGDTTTVASYAGFATGIVAPGIIGLLSTRSDDVPYRRAIWAGLSSAYVVLVLVSPAGTGLPLLVPSGLFATAAMRADRDTAPLRARLVFFSAAPTAALGILAGLYTGKVWFFLAALLLLLGLGVGMWARTPSGDAA